jgi:hypothetical protein
MWTRMGRFASRCCRVSALFGYSNSHRCLVWYGSGIQAGALVLCRRRRPGQTWLQFTTQDPPLRQPRSHPSYRPAPLATA